MPTRPSIPCEIKRQVLVESGHRCAVCGDPCPLELAHIVPWSESNDHSAANLICLCANCHGRADREKWGTKTLQEYKRFPWVRRKYTNVDDTPKESINVEIRIDIELVDFDDTKERFLQHAIAGFLEIPPDLVQVTSVDEGSTKVGIDLPEEDGKRLLRAHKNGDRDLADHLHPHLAILSIAHEPESWPAGLRDAVAVGNPLCTIECHRLTEGFIAHNLVTDLARFFRLVVEQRPEQVAGNITYQDIYDCLAALPADALIFEPEPSGQQPQPHSFDVLVSEKAAAEMNHLYAWHNPWRAIHLWLARDATLRLVTGRASTAAFEWARQTFQSIMTQHDGTPAEFHDRGPLVTRAFEAWWRACADDVAELLGTQLRNFLTAQSWRDLEKLFAEGLDDVPHLSKLLQLTKRKNNQLTICIGRVNEGMPRPDIPAGWLMRTGGRMHDAWLRGDSCQLGSTDLLYLDKIIDWVIDKGFEDLIWEQGVRRTVVWTISRPPRTPVSLKGTMLEQVLEAWQDLLILINMRNLPPVRMRNQPPIRNPGAPPARIRDLRRHWAISRPVQDLFSYPIR